MTTKTKKIPVNEKENAYKKAEALLAEKRAKEIAEVQEEYDNFMKRLSERGFALKFNLSTQIGKIS